MTAQLISLEPMKTEHLDGAVLLSREAGWPHRREDWELVLSVSEGLVALQDGRVVATTLMTPFGSDAAAINMVIVEAALRGRGVGRKLMDAALEKAGARSCRLVATKEGLPLYEKLGFTAIGEIAQHQGQAVRVEAPAGVNWAQDDEHEKISALDRAACDLDRSALMRILRRTVKFAVIRERGEVVAFAGVRAFGRGLVVGPVVARSSGQAKDLIRFMFAHHQGAFVRVDTDLSTGLGPWLAEHGLAHVGGGVSMRRGPDIEQAETSYCTFALVNQALG
ncbi:GNAT family N-acetyltransferase [Microvirga makkahensis]|uniref:GNAT family N-acetyltransferase n=1 Tax=Microvirga makkahensis TaxID=1128670 RepID=A0A7X3SRL8_9HYPH|nr:GNAT family N-acetyltransferase [Microvirga makkahensis]MXQ14209.1 GNAT family N-acetyltransferase [Microvirga makkahensis]